MWFHEAESGLVEREVLSARGVVLLQRLPERGPNLVEVVVRARDQIDHQLLVERARSRTDLDRTPSAFAFEDYSAGGQVKAMGEYERRLQQESGTRLSLNLFGLSRRAVRSRPRSRHENRKRAVTSSELEEYTRDFVAKVVAELCEHGELLTVAYLLVDDNFVLVPASYRTSLEKEVATAAIEALNMRLKPRAVFCVTRGWVTDHRAAVELEALDSSGDLVPHGPGDTLPTERRDAFCILARTERHALVAVTPYRVEPRRDGRTVTCGDTVLRAIA